jgi:hypothetical protein
MSSSVAIVTASNSNHFPLVTDMFRSLSVSSSRTLNLCCLDVGLELEQRDQLLNAGIELAEPQWDYPGEFPASWFRAMTARPHINRYFPGYDIYVWIDADCWLQNDSALETFITATDSHDVAVASSVHREYRQVIAAAPDQPGPPCQYYYAYLMQSLFKPETATRMSELPYLNGGVFALKATSPVWKTWQEVLGPLYERARDVKRPIWAAEKNKPSEGMAVNIDNKPLFHSEEIALNFAAWQAKPAILDATCNWLCSQRLPALDTNGVLITPGYPSQAISIVHLTAKTKDREFKIQQANGTAIKMSLRYPYKLGQDLSGSKS